MRATNEENEVDTVNAINTNAANQKFVTALEEIGLTEDVIAQCVAIFDAGMNEKMAESEKSIYNIKVNYGLETALRKANAINQKAVKPFLEGLDRAEFDESGAIIGLAEQIEALKNSEDTKFLFHDELGVQFRGVTVGEASDEEEKRPNFLGMKYSDMVQYLEKNPDAII